MAVRRTVRATSAGGVVHRVTDGRSEIALVHRRSPRLWALPKGTPDAGETLEATALRETREETGLEVELVRPLRAIEYWFFHDRTRIHKTVHFFLMRPVGGSTDAHDAEFDEVRWIEVGEALALLNYPTEREVVASAPELGAAAAAGERSA